MWPAFERLGKAMLPEDVAVPRQHLPDLCAGIVAIAALAFYIYSRRLDHLDLLGPQNLGPLVAVIAAGVCVPFLTARFNHARTTVALAAVFLVRYSIEEGYLSPEVRVVLAALFGVMVLAVTRFGVDLVAAARDGHHALHGDVLERAFHAPAVVRERLERAVRLHLPDRKSVV